MRRVLGFALLAVGLALAVFVVWPDRRAPIQRGRRSVLLITLDTTRADHLGPYGAEDVETPNLDRLARDGATLDNAFAVAPITLPAHTSILTGLYPFDTGVRNNGTHRVPARLTTLAERMRSAGFRTAAFVSASVLERRYGLDQGFELYDDDLAAGRERHPRVVPDRPAEATVASAMSWLESLEPDEVFFCWVHFYDPHAVYSPPPPYRDQYRERLYDGEIAYMDEQIGRLLEHPRLTGDSDLAIVVVGDHGESLGEHGERTHGILPYDATLHVPMFVRVPGFAPGARISQPVSQVDIVPTILDLLGADADPELPGRSIAAILEAGEEGPVRGLYSEAYLPYYTYGWAKLQVFRRGRWKYVAAPEPELFDLQRDPRELSNLVEQRAGHAHDMKRDLEELLAASGEPEREASLELDLDSLEMLRSLGYVAMGTLPPRDDDQRPDPKRFIELHTSLERARTFLDDRLFEEAEKELRTALAADPNNIAFLRELAAALEGQGLLDEATGALRRALSVDPDAASLYLTLSRLESRRGRGGPALELVDAALERDPEYLEAHLQRAQVLQAMGRAEEARAVLDSMLERDPENPRVNLVYAQLVDLSAGHWEAAETRLGRALARDPFMASAWLRLGQAQRQQGRLEAAAASFRQGLERAPDSMELHAALGTLLASSGGGTEAEQHLREAIRLSRAFRPELHVTLGAWLTEHRRPSEALREYELVLDQLPDDPGARNNRAIALFQVGRIDEAERDLLALARVEPENADVFNNLAAVAMNREDWTAMESRSRRAVELEPDMVEAWSNLGIALSRSGRLQEAEVAFQTAIELQPSYWQAKYNLAAALARGGKAKEAAALYFEVLGQDPNLPDVHLELGILYGGALEDPVRARDFLNAFLRHVAPEDPRVPEVRRRLAGLPPGAAAADN